MRIVAFGDIHEQIGSLDQIEGLSDASGVIVTGDLTNRGGVDRARSVIEEIRPYNPNIYAQAGNFDRREVETYLVDEGISLHGRGFTEEEVGIFGVGGSNPTPFKTPNEFSEDELTFFILQGYQKVSDAPCTLFVSHAPPFATRVDRVSTGQHVGSKAVRAFIEHYQPDVCITGHIHEARGEDRIGRTQVINPGMLKDGGYVQIYKEEGILRAVLTQTGQGVP